ncbi:MAG: DEAD/DEAH box helicase, partial [Anaerolineales bacterium]
VDRDFSDQEAILVTWERELDRLHEIVVLRGLAPQLIAAGLDVLVKVSLTWHEARHILADLLQNVWLTALLKRAMIEREVLRTFDGEMHEHAMRRFCELDVKLLNQNRIRLAYEHWKTIPNRQAAGRLGILRHEFAKKRRHKPIRRLMKETGNVIQVIKPVFMMSPLSIAQFLPPGSVKFDLVVFDEASQVKPVDAFGAILRGNQLVVVGDDRQLPPTTFFETSIDVDEDYSDSVTMDLESILGLSVAQGTPHRMLRWHYRSQHESLITVSNYEFYDHKLVIFPSPDKNRLHVGLAYHYLPETEYDRGGSRKNVGEAREVASAVMQHAKESPELTLGVATFSSSQQEAVRDAIEIARRRDSSLEEFFSAHPDEPFFVKNLENVQGDERDVIFISIGYGRAADGRVAMNFGPVNQDGGERRLNVLITRARKRCEVFTNLKPDDIDLGRTRSRGVHVLKRF